MPGQADVMTFGPESFAGYLAALRATATIASGPALTDAATLAQVQTEYITQHEQAVMYQYLGDDAAGPPVWRLGTVISLQDLTTQLAALVTAGSLNKVAGAQASYSCNPALRK